MKASFLFFTYSDVRNFSLAANIVNDTNIGTRAQKDTDDKLRDDFVANKEI